MKAWKRELAIGDEVYWNDPGEGISSGHYKITAIHSDSGRIEDEETIVVIGNDAGSVAEVWPSELS
jgi:hypothetical protein